MKKIEHKHIWAMRSRLLLLTLLVLNPSIPVSWAVPDNASYSVTPEDVIASVRMDNLHFDFAAHTASSFHSERERFGAELLKTFKDPKSSIANQCIAAYYLGEMRLPAAVDSLAANIKLNLNNADILIQALPVILRYPFRDALVKIGSPSIPAVIRNLAESDDALVRGLSLDVLTRIDGDKDVTQIRLQKALAAQLEPQKKARLQSALQALLDPKFGK